MKTCVRTRGNPRVNRRPIFLRRFCYLIERDDLLNLFLLSWNQSIRILDHAIISQSIYLRHDKAKEERKEGARKF